MAGTNSETRSQTLQERIDAIKAHNQKIAVQKGRQVAIYFETLFALNQKAAAEKKAALEATETAQAAIPVANAPAAPSMLASLRANAPKILAVAVTAATLFLSTISLAASLPLWPALALIGLATISSQGIFRLIDCAETFEFAALPTQPLVDLYHAVFSKTPADKSAAWQKFKGSLPQVLGALTLGITVGWSVLTQFSKDSSLLPIPFPAAIALAVAVGIWNYGCGSYTFAPDTTSTGKSVTFIGKLKDYWHQIKTENKWERGFRLLGHAFALGAGLALLASMTAGTGGAFFWLMLAAGIVQGIGLQRTGIPHFFVQMGATLLRPFGIHIDSPKTKVELAWSLAPKKVKVLAFLGVSIAMGTTAFLLLQGFAAVGIFASLGFPPLAAAIVTATFLGFLGYQLLQRFYFRTLPKDASQLPLNSKKLTQARCEQWSNDLKTADTLNRTPVEAVENMQQTISSTQKLTQACDQGLGWTASAAPILTARAQYALSQDLKSIAQWPAATTEPALTPT